MRYTQHLLGSLLTVLCFSAFAGETTPVELTDGQVGQVMLTVADGALAIGELPVERGDNVEVKAFAVKMVAGVTEWKTELTTLLTTLQISPEDSDLNKMVSDEMAKARAGLVDLRGAEFDIAFMDHEIACSNKLLGLLYHQLLQTTERPELRDFVLQSISKVSMTLIEAEKVRRGLGTMN